MPRLILQFEDLVLKECPVGLMATIGRLPDNTLVIDNPAVSSHHACVFRDGDAFVVEDLESTNGTYVNEARVTRHTLRNGDVLLVGKHKLVFDETVNGIEAEPTEEAGRVISNLGDTVFLDTKKHRELMSKLIEAQTRAKAAGLSMTTKMPIVPSTRGVLRVMGGRADRPEYTLDGRTSVIGKSGAALIRLRGWFKPNVAVAITRNGDGYAATIIEGRTRINDQPVTGKRDLKNGDVLRVSGLTLEFSVKTS